MGLRRFYIKHNIYTHTIQDVSLAADVSLLAQVTRMYFCELCEVVKPRMWTVWIAPVLVFFAVTGKLESSMITYLAVVLT